MSEFGSPLGENGIALAAQAVFAGNGVPLHRLSAYDRARVFGAVVRMHEEAWTKEQIAEAMKAAAAEEAAEKAAALDALDRLEAREARRAAQANRRASGGVAKPDSFLRDFLTSPEGMVLLNLLSAMVAIPTGGRVFVAFSPFPVPVGMMFGTSSRDGAQAFALRRYLAWKMGTLDEPEVTDAAKLRKGIRAWANSITPAEASNWLSATPDARRAAVPEIEAAGLALMATYARHLDALQVPIDGVIPGEPFGLPVDASPVAVDALDGGGAPRPRPTKKAAPEAPEPPAGPKPPGAK